MRDDLLPKFKEILAKSVITNAHNCIYNRAAVTFVKENEKDIDRELAAKLIKEALNITTNGWPHEMIYKMLTTCKIAVFLLDRFKADLKFIKTIINKLLDSHKEMSRLIQHKQVINSGKVLLNISSDCKSKISQLITDEEILELARSLPSTS